MHTAKIELGCETCGVLNGMDVIRPWKRIGIGDVRWRRGRVADPQQLRIILGIAKPLGAIILVVPGLAKLKEWAYAGFTFAWISAFIAHDLAKDGPMAFSPLVLLLLLVISYLTRPASRPLESKLAEDQMSPKP